VHDARHASSAATHTHPELQLTTACALLLVKRASSASVSVDVAGSNRNVAGVWKLGGTTPNVSSSTAMLCRYFQGVRVAFFASTCRGRVTRVRAVCACLSSAPMGAGHCWQHTAQHSTAH
jgi:hypothetical protein